MTSLLVVYYSDPPDSNWEHIISLANPGMTVVLDPTSNGAGSAQAANWSTISQRLRAAGARRLGYVWTNYGSRTGLGAKSDVTHYSSWYGLDGVFLDGAADVAQYAGLISLARSLGLSVVGNPGTTMSNSQGFDALITWEQSGYPPDRGQSFIAESVNSFTPGTGQYMYAVDTDYMHLPPYFDAMAQFYSTGSTPGPTLPLVVNIPPGGKTLTIS